MKKSLVFTLCVVFAISALALTGCGSNNSAPSSASASASASGNSANISVYSREDGSGTRGAFIELLGIQQKDSSGKAVDKTVSSAVIANSTQAIMTSVEGDANGIGYISLGSLNDTVKAASINGVTPTAAAVKDGSYAVSRPFNIATKAGLSAVAQDFINYIMSADGQKVIESNGYVSVSNNGTFTPSGASGKIVVAGSSSVSPVMEKLIEAYKTVNPGAEIELQTSDSTTGMNMAKEGSCDIGMASRELKDSETSAGLTPTVIAKDGIAIIVNKKSAITNLTTDQVKGIYTGEITKWSQVA